MKTKRNIIALLVLSCLVMTSPIAVHAAMITKPVNRIEQAKSNWCWAAAAETVGKYMVPSSIKSQHDVVELIHGSPIVNEGGSVHEIAKGMQLITNYTYAATGTSTVFFSFLADKMDQNKPSVIAVSWLTAGGVETGTAHALTVRGYDRSTDNLALVNSLAANTGHSPYETVNYVEILTGRGEISGNRCKYYATAYFN